MQAENQWDKAASDDRREIKMNTFAYIQISYTTAILVSLMCMILLLMTIYLMVQWSRSEGREKEAETRFRQLEGHINALQLETLEAKLNPHLFKNILNSIQSHAYQTYFALDKMANVLDYILYESRNRFVTPEEEIDFALNLIEINKIKVSPLFDLKVKLKIDENDLLYQQRLLAPLISIDLIENAFKHADLQSQDAFISIVFEFRNSQFYLTVSNKISRKTPIQKEKGGFGMETLEQRLRIIYKDRYKLDRFTEGDVYITHLKINLFENKT